MLCGTALAFTPTTGFTQEARITKPSLPQDYRPLQEKSATQTDQAAWTALGIDAGAFTFLPSLSLGQSVTDNAYQSSNKTASAIATVKPELQVQSNWSRHSLGFDGSATLNRYIGNSRRNETLWVLTPTGTVDIDKRFSVELEVNFSQQALNRFSAEIINDAAAVAIVRQNVYASTVNYSYGSWVASVKAEHRTLTYETLLLLDGTEQDQSYLNHDVDTLSASAEYSFSPDFTVFAQARWSQSDFGPSAARSAANSSSSGVKVMGGARIAVLGLGRLTVATDYAHRKYDLAGIQPVDGASAMALFEIFPSALTTVNIEVGHRFTDTNLLSGSAIAADYVQARVDHTLLRNLLLSLAASASESQNVQSSQYTDIRNVSFSARYMANRNFDLRGTMSYSSRKSTPQSSRGNTNELVGGLTATFKL
jgi:hypothetical protein